MSKQHRDDSNDYLHGVQIWKWRAMTKHSKAKTQKEKDEIFEWIQQETRRRTENRTPEEEERHSQARLGSIMGGGVYEPESGRADNVDDGTKRVEISVHGEDTQEPAGQ